MTFSRTKILLLSAAVASFATAQAFAQTVAYSSFDKRGAHDYYGPQALGIGGNHPYYLPAGPIALAANFVPTISGTLNHLDVAFGNLSGAPAATVTVVADNGAGAPDFTHPVLETLYVPRLPADHSTATKNTAVRSLAKPTLTSGQTYWLVVTPLAYDGNLFWYQSTTVDHSVGYTNNGGQTFAGYTSHQVAFDVWLNGSGTGGN